MHKLTFISLMGYYPWGGSEELWQKTAIHARKNNFLAEAHLFDSSMGHPKVKELTDAGVPVLFRKKTPGLADRLLRKIKLQSYNKRDTLNYWKDKFTQRPDLVIISGGTTFDCLHYPELFQTLAKLNLPYVYISQHHPEHGSLETPNIPIAQKIFTQAKKVFFVSQRNLNIVQRQLMTTLNNAEVVFNPINLQKVACLMHDYTPDKVLQVACVARLECANKGQDILLQALAQEKWKTRRIKFSFYGKGPDEQYLKELVTYLQLQHIVQFKGHVGGMAEVWKDNHILLMSSLAEGTPLALMEAMACGRSAVLTDVGGNKEWITDGYNGFIAPAPVPSLLDDALERMWQERGNLPEMGKRSYETFVNKYPSDAVGFFFNRLKDLL